VSGLPTLSKILGLSDDVLMWCRGRLRTTRDSFSGPIYPEDIERARAGLWQRKKCVGLDQRPEQRVIDEGSAALNQKPKQPIQLRLPRAGIGQPLSDPVLIRHDARADGRNGVSRSQCREKGSVQNLSHI
jgi:hypothetical protein